MLYLSAPFHYCCHYLIQYILVDSSSSILHVFLRLLFILHKITFVKLYFWLHIAPSDVFTRRPGLTFEVCGHLKYMKHLSLRTCFKHSTCTKLAASRSENSYVECMMLFGGLCSCISVVDWLSSVTDVCRCSHCIPSVVERSLLIVHSVYNVVI